MKIVHFVRHAKSSWDNLLLQDIERPLNKRGKNDILTMPEFFKETKVKLPEVLVSSTARRARDTAAQFKISLKINNETRFEKSLYHADVDTIELEVSLLSHQYDCAMFFGHNPGYTYLANKYAFKSIKNIPTSGIFTIASESDDWQAFFDKPVFKQFIYPKLYAK